MGDHEKLSASEMARRHFMFGVGALGAAAAIGGDWLLFPEGFMAIPNAEGFLLVDMKKCQGCSTCMMACALAHTGEASYTLSRIQIQQDSFMNWPDDIFMATCRQCKDAPCVEVCPVEPIKANKPNPAYGNVRMIDQELCIGCGFCVATCPYTPGRVQWDHKKQKSQKCDLCADTPFLGERGGPGGTQTCVKVCPVGAITFTRIMPDQGNEQAYFVNLRNAVWERLGMTAN